MIKDILKMGGCKTEKEFYAKYPTEKSFLEAFPQARPMMEQFASGGEAFPQQPTEAQFFNYGPKTPNIPMIFQTGGAMDPVMQVISAVAEQMQMDPNQLVQVLQQSPEIMAQFQTMVSQDPQQAAQALMQMIQGQGQQQMAMEEEMPQEEMMQQPMMAYGGNPFAESSLSKFVYGGLPKAQEGKTVVGKDGRTYLIGKDEDGKTIYQPVTQDPSLFGQIYKGVKGGLGNLVNTIGSGAKNLGSFAVEVGVPAAAAVAGRRLFGPMSLRSKLGWGSLGALGAAGARTPAPRAAGDIIYNNPALETPANATNVAKYNRSDSTMVDFEPFQKEKGGSLFNYGQFSVPMAKGGTSAPMGYTQPDNETNKRLDILKRYIKDNVDQANEEEMMKMFGMNPQLKKGGSKKKVLTKAQWGTEWWMNKDKEGEEKTQYEYDPGAGVTGPVNPGQKPIELDVDPNYEGAFKDDKQEKDFQAYHDKNIKKCPKGYKWDKVKQQCYRDVYQTGQPLANAMIRGMNKLADIAGADERRNEEAFYNNMGLPDFMPVKQMNRAQRYGMMDTNTFQNPFAGTYNTNFVPGSYTAAKKGGEIAYLTDDQINEIISLGGEVEFLD